MRRRLRRHAGRRTPRTAFRGRVAIRHVRGEAVGRSDPGECVIEQDPQRRCLAPRSCDHDGADHDDARSGAAEARSTRRSPGNSSGQRGGSGGACGHGHSGSGGAGARRRLRGPRRRSARPRRCCRPFKAALSRCWFPAPTRRNLVLVSVVMVLLPLVYLAIIAGTISGLQYHAIANSRFVTDDRNLSLGRRAHLRGPAAGRRAVGRLYDQAAVCPEVSDRSPPLAHSAGRAAVVSVCGTGLYGDRGQSHGASTSIARSTPRPHFAAAC